MKLEVLPLDQKTFSAYGDVIETQERDFFHINNGLVERYHDLAKVEVLEQDRTLISINRAQPAAMPIVVHELERHPLGTQAFISNGRQGVNYHRNVWHHPLFAWQTVTDFLTVDRGGSDNCDVESIPTHELCFA
ncbi:ureidoglycolate lyase [Salmonella enterica]|uniref:ureidoglycolate lyase n=1 Tax=Salmonella enterica TaxID=28901 RepID=UPI000E6B890B|nr:ureidoglycolate lyase [Salmonella enterica]AYB10087.1 ureidoglycolate lyase [Salmonella enterica subsp. enterica serovar Dublin]EBC3636016.1 ureidoglycolate lyase [Salmonella enterica]EBC4107804.1 ureidoglycolate lyase [Salmonella enterica]EBE1019961.1 ureidoglycolate lyase [Salmonella enterica]EBL3576293.1 ureidoglycolate lyase [Salmonella enterica subsp. enterica serovar Dublin]